jgi:hypothetical protein
MVSLLLAHGVIFGVLLLGSLAAVLILPSFWVIGPTEVGLVVKRFSWKKLGSDNPIAFRGEAGYQEELLMPGVRFKLSLLYQVKKYPWVQVPPGEIGVVIAQVGDPLPVGAKSAVYKPEFGDFTNLRRFIQGKGQKGVQRSVLPPGTLAVIHPVGFLVITKQQVYGLPISPQLKALGDRKLMLTPAAFGLKSEQLSVVRIEPQAAEDGKVMDVIGIVTTYEGQPLDAGDIASRLGGFEDIAEMEKAGQLDSVMVETLLGNKNEKHNNYQDFQKFLDGGGKIGLQNDPLLYGAFNLNPFLVSVEMVPMLVVQQGQVAVVKAYVGLPTQDTSGTEFKFGSLVRPGHRGIWREPLRTGKFAINPRCYAAIIVPTSILTLNWADAVSQAHNLDKNLQQIVAKSKEGFVFKIDLQVQIHVPDVMAPKVISTVGTMQNLVNEVLQAAVGNHFRDKLQSMPAISFIETRQEVQKAADEHISEKLKEYSIETRGVYIQDVVLPAELVSVLTQREIAKQEIATLQKQREAQDQRIETEKAKGTADMQASLAKSKVGIDIKQNDAAARKAEADGEATYIQQTGNAKGAEIRAVGLARAEAYEAQRKALSTEATALVNAIEAIAKIPYRIVPEVLVTGGEGGGAVNGLMGVIMEHLRKKDAGAVVQK